MNPGISVVIPVYNEEKALKKTLKKIIKTCSSNLEKYEIIAINDSSTDNSAEILEKFNQIKIIHHEVNKGYGASLKTGIENSKHDWIFITDADGTYPVEDIPKLVQLIPKFDLVIGKRDIDSPGIPFKRKYPKMFLNKYASYLAGERIPDLNSGLRVFKKEMALDYWTLFPERFSFTSTLTMIAFTRGYNTKYIPIEYREREGESSIKSPDFFRFLNLVTKLSLFFRPIKVFAPLSLVIFLLSLLVPILYFAGVTERFLDTSFMILISTSLQTFFFGLLAEIFVYYR